MTNSKSTLSNTGYKGISFNKQIGRFESYIVKRNPAYNRNKVIKLSAGTYKTLEEAITAREAFINSLF